MIDSYSFGRIVIDGHEHRCDVAVHPGGRIVSPWWREEGHRLTMADLARLMESKPEILIAGTGSSGMVQPDDDIANLLARQDIQFVALPTDEAVSLYNDVAPRRKVAACFHLTC